MRGTVKAGTMIPISLVVKLASIVVHADEASDPTAAHPFDLMALRTLVTDAEVIEWIKSIGPLAPVKRSG